MNLHSLRENIRKGIENIESIPCDDATHNDKFFNLEEIRQNIFNVLFNIKCMHTQIKNFNSNEKILETRIRELKDIELIVRSGRGSYYYLNIFDLSNSSTHLKYNLPVDPNYKTFSFIMDKEWAPEVRGYKVHTLYIKIKTFSKCINKDILPRLNDKNISMTYLNIITKGLDTFCSEPPPRNQNERIADVLIMLQFVFKTINKPLHLQEKYNFWVEILFRNIKTPKYEDIVSHYHVTISEKGTRNNPYIKIKSTINEVEQEFIINESFLNSLRKLLS